MTEDQIRFEILASLDIVAMERLEGGVFKLLGSAPRWLSDFLPEAASEGAELLPQENFMFLGHFMAEAEDYWNSDDKRLLRSGVWSEAYAAGKEHNLEASAFRVGDRKLLVIERLRSAYGDIRELAQKARDKNLDYDRLRRAEEALRKSEDRYRDLFENTTDLIQSCAPDGKLIYANRAWCEALGYSADEVSGLSIFDIIHINSRQHCLEMFKRVMSGETVDGIEATFVTKDGSTIRVEGSSSCRFKDGLPVATRSIFRNITKRHRAEQALWKSEQQLQAILDNSSAVIYLKDYWGQYILINKRFEKLFNIAQDLAVGKSDFDLFPRDVAEVFRADDLKVFEAGKALEFEETVPHEDGPHIYLAIKFPLLDRSGEPYALGGIAADITERKRIDAEVKRARDAALESTRKKAEFLANMSHEIRTPMNAIIGMSGLLFETQLSGKQREFATTVRSSAEALLSLINDILDFSKIEAGKLTFEVMDFDLYNAVEGAIDFVAEQANAKGIELSSLIESDVPTLLWGDPSRLRQVLTNFLSNAVKFTEKGNVSILITKQSVSGGHTTIRFEVSDTGIGIPEQAQLRIFDAFSQAEGSTARKYGGTGLGLAICKQLVELMGGKIGVESTPGKGSKFWFTANFERQAVTADQTAPESKLRGLKVLVVDDNATNRNQLHSQIVSWRMRNGTAKGGEEALAILRRESAAHDPYDIAILDLKMPEMDGLILARKIKEDPSIAGTRLLMMTPLESGDESAILEAGVERCLTKPIKHSQLFDCLLMLAGSSTETKSAAQNDITGDEIVDTRRSENELRILVAEDSGINQRVAQLQLEQLGHSADLVSNGVEALRALERDTYDVVFMDCHMPEMDGFEATRQIRKREGNNRHTTIIAMTASASDGDREECLAAGMDDYISKPVNPEALREAIERKRPRDRDALGTQIGTELSGSRSGKVVDTKTLDALRDLQTATDGDFLNEIIDLFIKETPHRLSAIKGALANSNARLLAQQAHALKGSTVQLGATRMTDLCEILEEQGRNESIGAAPGVAETLEEEFQRVCEVLQQKKNPPVEKVELPESQRKGIKSRKNKGSN